MAASASLQPATIEDIFAAMQRMSDKLSGEINDVSQSLHDFMHMTAEQFNKVDARFDKMEERFDRLEGRMDTLEGRMDTLEDRMGALEGRMDSLEGRMDAADSRQAKMQSQLLIIRTKLRNHDMQFDELTRLVRQLLDEHTAHNVDMEETLDRITMLEQRQPVLSEDELREMQHLLQTLADWALKTAAKVEVPLSLPT